MLSLQLSTDGLFSMKYNKHILIVEDEIIMARSLKSLLELQGYRVNVVLNAQDALREFGERIPDLILLDVVLPDMHGFDLLRKIRNVSNVPVVIVSASSREVEKVRGFEAGADDFISKPFHDEELMARIAALLRRISWTPQAETVLEVGPLRLDMTRRQVTLRGRILHLTPIEYAILATLMQRAGEIVSHDELLESVWGPSYQGDFSVLRVNISRLRQKIEERPRYPNFIVTVPRQGYRMPVDARV